MSTATAFEKLNKALGEYYESQGVKDYYGEETPNGKFIAYCEDNGFELEDIDDELSMDAADCSYCDFDASFPLNSSLNISTEDERIEAIFGIIKQCYNKACIAGSSSFDALNLELNTTPNDLKRAEALYSAQCPKIYLQAQEETLRCVFAIGLKNDISFISYLADSYQRDRMMHPTKDLTAAAWASHSPYIKSIKNKSVSTAESIESGIETYMKRVAPRFHWKAMNTIRDDIQAIVSYFIAADKFIVSLLEKQEITPPFAYDVVIVVKNAVSNSQMVIPDLSDDDDDVVDDNDDNDDDDDLKMNGNDDSQRYLSNIEERLNDNNCEYIAKSVNVSDKERGFRFLPNTFREFEQKLKSKYKNAKEYDMKHYPRKKRFCTFIDRRSDDEKDSMIMFEPPDDCNTLPDQHVADWYFNAAKTCIIPCKGYSDDDNMINDPQCTLCVDRAYKGQVITFSFQIDSAESLRCYLFWNGCYIRIVHPHDLKYILKAIFDIKYNKNEQYIESNQFKHDIQQIIIVDHTFDAFYKQVTINKQ